jgi:hypothetical protein
MNASEKLSAPLRGAEHYNQIDPSTNVRKTLDTTFVPNKQIFLPAVRALNNVLVIVVALVFLGELAEQSRHISNKDKTYAGLPPILDIALELIFLSQ